MTAIRHPQRIWLAALVLAWSADLLFWNHNAGISFPLWIGLCLAGIFACAAWEKIKAAWPSYLLAAAALGLALPSFTRSEPFSRAFSAFLAFSCLGLLAATLTNGNWLFYRLGDLVAASFKLIAAAIVRAAVKLGEKPPVSGEAVPGQENRGWKAVKKTFPYLRGILIALPVLGVLGGLLASADPVFGEALRSLLKVFDLARLPEYLFRLFYILILAYIFTGEILHALQPDPTEPRPNPSQAWKARFLGSTEAFIILGGVIAMFVFFVILQFRYLFGGQSNITAAGYTYSDYARRGFFELVWVAVLSLALYLGLGTVTRRERPAARRAFRVLSGLLLLLVLVILASAWQRLLLYEGAYGFTRLRLYTHIFIPWLGLLLLAALALELLGRAGRFGLAFLLFSFGFGLSFSALNVDELIVRYNLERTRAGIALDVAHLAGLSTDAIPALAQAYSDPGQPAEVRDQTGAALACQWKAHFGGSGDTRSLGYAPDWRSYNLSEANAVRILRGLDLKSYLTQGTNGWEVQAKGTTVNCSSSYTD